jgi:hypothetical protein
MLAAHFNKRGKPIMSNLDIKFVAAACPELTASECEALLAHCRDITRSDNDIYPHMLRCVSRSLFPDIDRRHDASPLAPEDIAKLNVFRMSEAIASLEAAQKWLSKVRNPSDTVGMAIRDIGIIADQLQGAKQ